MIDAMFTFCAVLVAVIFLFVAGYSYRDKDCIAAKDIDAHIQQMIVGSYE